MPHATSASQWFIVMYYIGIKQNAKSSVEDNVVLQLPVMCVQNATKIAGTVWS